MSLMVIMVLDSFKIARILWESFENVKLKKGHSLFHVAYKFLAL